MLSTVARRGAAIRARDSRKPEGRPGFPAERRSMAARRLPCIVSLTIIASLTIMGCQPAPAPRPAAAAVTALSAQEYNQALIVGNELLFNAGKAFGDELQRCIQDKKGETERLRGMHDHAVRVIRNVRHQFRAIIPPATDSARALRQVYIKYLDRQESVFVKQYSRILGVMEDQKLSDLERGNLALSLLGEPSRDDGEHFQNLRRAQNDFLREHELEKNTEEK